MKKFFCYGKKDFCENTDLCIECPHFAGAGGEYREAPMTNADRIRAMSDEELTRKITDGNVFFGCPQCSQGDCRKCDLECGKHCLEWLQSPAEEADHA